MSFTLINQNIKTLKLKILTLKKVKWLVLFGVGFLDELLLGWRRVPLDVFLLHQDKVQRVHHPTGTFYLPIRCLVNQSETHCLPIGCWVN